MKRISLSLLFCLLYAGISAQSFAEAEKLILGDTIVFMGVDYSMARFVNPDKLGQGEAIRDRHGRDWAQVDEMMERSYDLYLTFHKKRVITMPSLFDKSYEKIDTHWIVRACDTLSDEALRAHIAQYPLMLSKRLGAVTVIDRLDNETKRAYITTAIIDLQDNSVLKVFHTSGRGAGYGYGEFYNSAIGEAFLSFGAKFDKYYREVKKYFKQSH
jgi:hypothetical protein